MLKETWRNSGLASRSGLLGGAVLILTLALAAAWWLLQNRNGVLFSDLEPADAAAVVTELERMKVAYQLAADGTRILVDGDRVHEIRLKLLGSGLPLSGSIGFELFDKAEFGMTEFAQRINFQRAMQGELTRTITSLKEVKYARVHLVMPEASLFKQDKNPPSASITLFLKPGAQLDQQQTKGIQRLVAASVPGLESGGVTIVDQYGKTLSAVVEDESAVAAVSTRLQKKQEVEAYLTTKVARVLERTFGPGKVIVSVDVTLNFDQSKSTREEVIPGTDENGGVVHKRESRTQLGKEKSKNNNPGEVDTEVEYRLGRAVAQIVSSPGGIERLSVGVLVPAGADEEQLQQIEELVAMTVGLDRTRGDGIAVHAAAGEILPAEQAAPSLESPGLDGTWGDGIAVHAGAGEILSAKQVAPSLESPPASDTVDFTQTDVREAGPAEAVFDGALDDAYQVLAQASRQGAMVGELAASADRLWAQHRESITIVGGSILLLLILLISVMTKRRHRQRADERRRLTAERERILGQLKAWINADELTPKGEGETT